ncbi:ComF family protein [Luedemannella helvata]|uniref:ComF family protein n=1 Tax=Luedemannella helvata TaxID=349315 RepID=A0ABN2K160_9ACTN
MLPVTCAACGRPSHAVAACEACLTALSGAVPGPTRPEPAPDGLPPCVAAATYEGPVRELLLAFKERGERSLAGPLGHALARAVATGAPAGCQHLVLVAVPTTAAAARRRGGDHMAWLVSAAARALRRAGWRVTVLRPVRARPRADSTELDRAGRARAAREAFAPRRRTVARTPRGAGVVVVDDVITTGATVAAVSQLLARLGMPAAWAASVAATRLRRPSTVRQPVATASQELWITLPGGVPSRRLDHGNAGHFTAHSHFRGQCEDLRQTVLAGGVTSGR